MSQAQVQEVKLPGTNITVFDASDYNDECPVHGGEMKKEYNFGIHNDATIFTHHGCRCCVMISHDLGGYVNDSAYLGSYDELKGCAVLHREYNKVKNRW
jgi:hypothetical protein